MSASLLCSLRLARIVSSVALSIALTACRPPHAMFTPACTKPAPGTNTTAEMIAKFDDITPQQLKDYINNNVDFKHGKANTAHRKCKKGTGNCSGAPGSGTDVTISPEQYAKDLGACTGTNAYITLPGTGSHSYIIARLTNDKNGETEDWLGLAKGDSAFWLVEPDGNGNARSRFVQISLDSQGNPVKSWLTNIGYLHYFACNHDQRNMVEGQFADCSSVTSSKGGATASAKTTGTRTDPTDIMSTWMSCPAGCCSTSQ